MRGLMIDPRDVTKDAAMDWQQEWARDQVEVEQALFEHGLREVYRMAYLRGIEAAARRWY